MGAFEEPGNRNVTADDAVETADEDIYEVPIEEDAHESVYRDMNRIKAETSTSDSGFDVPHAAGLVSKLRAQLEILEHNPKSNCLRVDEYNQGAQRGRTFQESSALLVVLGKIVASEGKHEGRDTDAAKFYAFAAALFSDLDISYRLGNSYYRMGNYTKAVDAFQTGLAGAAPVGCAGSTLPKCSSEKLPSSGPASRKLQRVSSVGNEPPLIARTWVNLGVAYEAQMQLPEATNAYKEALVLFPAYPAALKLHGGALLAQGRFQEAEQALAQATEMRVDFAEAWADLGTSRRWMGDHRGALTALTKAASLQGDMVVAQWNLVQALRDCAEYELAIKTCQHVLELQPTMWAAHIQLALCRVGLGQPPADVLQELQAAAALAPNSSSGVTSAIQQLGGNKSLPGGPLLAGSNPSPPLQKRNTQEDVSVTTSGDATPAKEIGLAAFTIELEPGKLIGMLFRWCFPLMMAKFR
eukprot:gene12312-14541_t